MNLPSFDTPVASADTQPGGVVEPPPSRGAVDPPAERMFNREVSWLDFNARVLALAEDATVPLLERVRFLAIFFDNLDEFFRVRVAGLLDRKEAGTDTAGPDGMTTSEQLAAINERTRELVAIADRLYTTDLVERLHQAEVHIVEWDDLTAGERRHLGQVFAERVFPVLTPLAVDPGHPFPYLSDLSLNLAVQVRDPDTEVQRFARVKVPGILPGFLALPDGERFIGLAALIEAHLDELFPGMEVVDHHAFRVTRNASMIVDAGDADDLLEVVEQEIRQRRFGRAVRLEIAEGMSDAIREMLISELELEADDVHVRRAPLNLTSLTAVADIDRPDLTYSRWKPVLPSALGAGDDVDVFRVLKSGEVFVHHPYESFTGTVEAFIRTAADDPAVLAIKMTLYRTSGDSEIVKALIRAAEAGKQVAVVIEVTARFDEEANIRWARRLEKAGVHVVYGLVGLKVHTKIALVVRSEGSGLRRYCHVGTGNYNPRTARYYEDMGLLSADSDLADDLGQLFNSLTGLGRQVPAKRIVAAPTHLRETLAHLIEREIAAGPGQGWIVAKTNALTDTDIIERLYAASQAGVEIDLTVRGACSLRPGVPGLSENIRVRSILGRFLEHSRIYRFANGNGMDRPLVYIGSADLMPRNLNRRVEAVVELTAPTTLRRVDEVLAVLTSDELRAWHLQPGGEWIRSGQPGDEDPQERLHELASARSR